MSGEIASLLVKLGLDASAFTAGIAQADKTSAAFGKSLVTRSSVAKAGFVALGSGLAIVTQAGLQAEDAQGKFMAATGASREEAKAFVSEMDGLAGTNGAVGKSFEDIASAGTMVAQQFGTTGQQTADLTSQILEFSKVTNTDATQAAAGMDDALSAYGLSADDASGFMDTLIKSSQTFGTSVGVDTVKQIQDLAPAVETLGGNIDDAVALENAFEVAGVDAGQAQKDLNAAITKLPPGTTLDDIVAHLGAIQDPAQRAQEAIDLLGTKAGLGLSKLIKPGMKSMDDFAVSAQDAAGTLDTAAGSMLTTGDKITALKDKFLAGAREIGQQFGPALTGAASAASLIAPFAKQFGKLAAPAAQAFAKPFTTALGKAMSSLSGSLTNALTPAIGEVGTAAGGQLGGLMGAAMGPALAIGAGAIIAVVIDQIVQKAAAQLSQERQKFAAALELNPAEAQQAQQQLSPFRGLLDITGQFLQTVPILGAATNQIGTDMRGVGTDIDAAAASAGDMHDSFKPIGADLSGDASSIDSAATDVSTAFDQYVQAWEDGSKSVIENGQELAGFDPDLGAWMTGKDFLNATPDVQAAIQTWIDKQNSAVQTGVDTLGQSLDDMRKTVTDKLSGIQDAFDLGIDTKKKKNVSGTERLKQMADDIDTITKNLHDSVAANDPVNTAYWEAALITAQQKYDTASQNIGVDAAQISSDLGAAGVSMNADWLAAGKGAKKGASKINQAADSVNPQPAATKVSNAADDIHDSFVRAGQSAKAVPAGIEDHIDDANAAAQRLANSVTNPVSNIPPDLYSYGEHASAQWVAGLKSGATNLGSVASHWANLLENKLGFSTPPPEGPLHDLPNWGPHMIDAWIQPMLRHGMTRIPKAAQQLAEWLKTAGQHKSADWYDTAAPLRQHRRRHNGVSNPSVADTSDSSAGITINVTVQGNVYGTGGVKQLAKDLETYIKRSQRGGARLVGAF